MINTNNLKLAEIRRVESYTEGEKVKHHVAIDNLSYVLLVEKDGEYYNPFCVEDNYPVYGRTPYTNTTLDGEDYGNILYLASGEEKEGLCLVLSKLNLRSYLGADEVSVQQLEDYILKSKNFFKDKKSIVDSRFKNRPFKARKELKDFMPKYFQYLEAINQVEKGYQFKKVN